MIPHYPLDVYFYVENVGVLIKAEHVICMEFFSNK